MLYPTRAEGLGKYDNCAQIIYCENKFPEAIFVYK